MAIGQLGGAVALLLPLAVVSLPETAPSTVVTLSMLGLAFVSTAVAYLIYFRLIENVGPTSTLTVTLLVPVFGLLFGVLLLDEPFGFGTLAGLGIILTSVVLITGIAPGRASLKKTTAASRRPETFRTPGVRLQASGFRICGGQSSWLTRPPFPCHGSWEDFCRKIQPCVAQCLARIEDHLRASEERYRLAALLVGDGSVPHLCRAATVGELRFAPDRTPTFGPDEVALQFYGRKALCAFGQVHKRSVAARGIREGDHRRRVQVAVRGHEFLTEIEAARDLTFLRFQYRQPEETGQGSDTAFVQLVESRHLRGLQGNCHGSTDYPRGESRCLRSTLKR